GDDFREGKITLPVVLCYRRGNAAERAFLQRTLQQGEIGEDDLAEAFSLMKQHNALADTMERARHYGAIARDALAIFPDSDAKAALLEAIEFCVERPFCLSLSLLGLTGHPVIPAFKDNDRQWLLDTRFREHDKCVCSQTSEEAATHQAGH